MFQTSWIAIIIIIINNTLTDHKANSNNTPTACLHTICSYLCQWHQISLTSATSITKHQWVSIAKWVNKMFQTQHTHMEHPILCNSINCNNNNSSNGTHQDLTMLPLVPTALCHNLISSAILTCILPLIKTILPNSNLECKTHTFQCDPMHHLQTMCWATIIIWLTPTATIFLLDLHILMFSMCSKRLIKMPSATY